jgi:predicted aspartyl protease
VANGWMVLAVVWVGLGGGLAAQGQAATAAAQKKVSCKVNSAAPGPAETSLNKGDYSEAETRFRDLLTKSAGDETAHEGLIRALLEQDKLDAAAKDAEGWTAASPASSMAMVAWADVLLRQGDPRGAFLEFQKAALADPCNARAYLGLAHVDELAGLHASGKRWIEQAYALHPTDDQIEGAWVRTRPRAERLQRAQDYAEHSDQISEKDRAQMKASLAKQSMYHPSDCRAAPTSPETATVPMGKILDGPDHFVGWGLDVKFNGRTRRLQIDTGASGITISRAAALFLGIQRQDTGKMGGIGDQGLANSSITHVASVRIGGIEFTNCAVEILEKWSALDSDGLIGADVFAQSQVTLDFPRHELRIAPLPPRPGEAKSQTTLDAAGNDDAEVWHDPYIAPEMSKWLRIYRNGHELLMPSGIVDTKRIKDETAWKEKLFMLDTGSFDNLISTAAAREVTKIDRDDSIGVSGISGKMNKVYDSGNFTLAFANLRLDPPRMTAIDMTNISHDAGVEVSGLIGAPALSQLVLHIDYRDNLVWCEYSPNK